MAHHLIKLENIDWIKNFHNCFLIRHPKKVINSYIIKNKLNNIDELGYPQQWHLMEYLINSKKDIIVIDSSALLKNPKKILIHWCEWLDIGFDEKMLRWEKGPYNTDGIWWKHWYNSVVKTNTFAKNHSVNNEEINIDDKYFSIYKESMYYYNAMLEKAI